jgi:hypothetical protein
MKSALLATAISLATLVTWAVTGWDAYTKFQVVESTRQAIDSSDPLAGTGFYEDETAQEQVQVREQFRLGLLPTPQGLFDKHLLSVTTILFVTWGLWVLSWWLRVRRPSSLAVLHQS